MISLSLQGIKGLQAAINRKEKALTQGIDMEMQATAMDINAQQMARVPVDKGFLKSSLKFNKNAVLNYEIVSAGAGSSYAPYIEFGTGGMVDIPKGLADEASQYKGRGVRKVNMRAQPFFFAPAFKEFKELQKRILKLLEK